MIYKKSLFHQRNTFHKNKAYSCCRLSNIPRNTRWHPWCRLSCCYPVYTRWYKRNTYRLSYHSWNSSQYRFFQRSTNHCSDNTRFCTEYSFLRKNNLCNYRNTKKHSSSRWNFLLSYTPQYKRCYNNNQRTCYLCIFCFRNSHCSPHILLSLIRSVRC